SWDNAGAWGAVPFGLHVPCGYGLLLYLRPKRPAPHAPVSGRKASGCSLFPEPSPLVAGRPFRVAKGGGRSRRRRAGDTERKGLPAAAGPVSSRRDQAQEQTRRQQTTWG